MEVEILNYRSQIQHNKESHAEITLLFIFIFFIAFYFSCFIIYCLKFSFKKPLFHYYYYKKY